MRVSTARYWKRYLLGKNRVYFKRYRTSPVEIWAYVRVKNEIATVEASLNSILPAIQKGVIGYHNLEPHEQDDGTIAFLHQFVKEHPGFKLVHYDHVVYPAHDPRYKHLETVPESAKIHHFYQAVLDEIPKGAWFFKVDCDHIYDAEKLKALAYLPKKDNEMIAIPKLNLHAIHNSDQSIDLFTIGSGLVYYGDHWLLKNNNVHFDLDVKHSPFSAYEMLKHKCRVIFAPVNSWHFPFMKKHRKLIDFSILHPFKEFSLKNLRSRLCDPDMVNQERILKAIKHFKWQDTEPK